MRSMFFKRSRCREGKGLDKASQGAETRAPPMAPGVVTRGRQNSLWCLLRKAARRPHGDCRHGGAFTRISMATAQSLEKASPPGGTRALSPLQVFAGVGTRKKGQGHLINPPHCTPIFPISIPTLHHHKKTNGRTHLSTAHVSLTARAGFPWSMGFLKSVRSSSNAMICGQGGVTVSVGAGPLP